MDRRELLTKVINGEMTVQDARGLDKKSEAIFFEDGHYHSTSDHVRCRSLVNSSKDMESQ